MEVKVKICTVWKMSTKPGPEKKLNKDGTKGESSTGSKRKNGCK